MSFQELTAHLIHDGDLLSNRVHRHEPPISSNLPKIVADDDRFFVVDKPCSMPIHPVAQYRHNSLIFVLAREFNANYHVVHRLDRLTSGLVIFAKTKEVSQEVTRQITNRLVSKEYVCRVVGHFPDTAVCDGPIFNISPRKGIFYIATTPDELKVSKDAHTKFELIYYDKESGDSVVRARPKTGRTHQIRVHLQYLGYPIRNDPIYNDPVFGPERFQSMKQKENLTAGSIIDGLSRTRNWGDNMYRVKANASPTNTAQEVIDPICDKCSEEPADPLHEDLILYLHAFKYAGPDWTFETQLPEWAHEQFRTPTCYKKYD